VPRHVALLRGVNLGSHNRVSMEALRDLARRLGYGEPSTFLQSGNLVLTSRRGAEQVGRELEEAIRSELGIRTPVVVRSRDELAAVVARDPLGHIASNPSRYLVSFLSAEPTPDVVRDLRALEPDPEAVEVHGREIYAWHPHGVHASPLARLLTDRRLGVTATARNWTTVTQLLALADA
jgi:uncharacterized protein (DUF1697 family)